MSEMLERLSKALGDVAYGYVDRATRPNTWDRSMALARAAVEAMREPTDEMTAEAGIGSEDSTEIWTRMINAIAKAPDAE